MTTPLNFRQQLGAELAARAADLPATTVTATTARVRPRHTRRLVVTGLGLAAAVTGVVLMPHTGGDGTAPKPQAGPAAAPTASGGPAAVQLTTASYSVTPNTDGTVSFQLIGADWSGLQSALRSVGVPALVMTPSESCHTPVATDGSRLESVMSLDPRNGRIAILHPAAIPPGESLLLINTAPKGALHPGTVGNLDISLTKETPGCVPLSQTSGIGEG
ncbi:hypothetical protein ATKI12_4809 [Kitasatospora sp. Ki12]|uniref:hypothetical protein n=1 Tax=Kitasatospora xanthocidica TaxID=83382 RepID=UPI0016719319|nr:hypothetical protein [Kitasatospora xanthocidica]GHF60964.1 hypothetical protein GCM10018790_43820 [Kitasatospora xanthocidica]